MLTAGIDIGNSTTEVLLADLSGHDLRPVAVRSAPTAGRKGSGKSLAAAAALLEEAETAADRKADVIAVARLHPVQTFTAPAPLVRESRRTVVRIDRGTTPAGEGFAVGRHLPLDAFTAQPTDDPVIASVPQGSDFDRTARRLRAYIASGWNIAGVVAAGDDAVLIGNRLDEALPIADEADVAALPVGARIALEVAPIGRTLRVLTDPIAVAAALDIPASELQRVGESIRDLADLRAAALVVADQSAAAAHPPGPILEYEAHGRARRIYLDDRDVADQVRYVRPGAARLLCWDGGGQATAPGPERMKVTDAYLVDLRQLADVLFARHDAIQCDALALAAIAALPADTVAADLGDMTGRPVHTVGSEARAAHVGAATTPGLPDDVTICDIGGGTIDVVPAGSTPAVTAAGGGQLVTAAVAAALSISTDAAERTKRGPSAFVRSAFLLEQENGDRSFTRTALPAEVIGRLCVPSAGSMLPIDEAAAGRLTAPEWRTARLYLKDRAIARNVERCLRHLSQGSTADILVLSGGGALDDEVVRIVGTALRPSGAIVGRANVLGQFGPRYAVAAGLVRLLADPTAEAI
jgi:hypothetical protein